LTFAIFFGEVVAFLFFGDFGVAFGVCFLGDFLGVCFGFFLGVTTS